MGECKFCKSRGKTWSGADPICAFPDGGVFHSDNWNCGALGKLRAIAEENDVVTRDDMSAGSFGYVIVDNDYASNTYEGLGGYIAMAWYKNRGRTGNAVFINDHETLPLTLEHVEIAIRTHEMIKRMQSEGDE